ncbi:MAG: ATP-binding protein [Phycisphaeraceae bacterium]
MLFTFWTGLAAGVLLTIPLIVIAMRRTERRVRQLEQRASTAERLAELGTLTGGLAHEIKNPLSSVNLNVQLLQEDLAELSKDAGRQLGTSENPAGLTQMQEKLGRIRRRFESLSREVQRVRDILEDFLRFAGRLKLDLQPTNLVALVDELVDFFTPQAQAMGITIRTQHAAGELTAPADAALLKQSLLNLMLNACQAMAQARDKSDAGSTGASCDLIVRTGQRETPEGELAEIHVTDTGPGISPEHLAKIFQPYFSTKKTGTGLGLPTTRRIVQEHGGTIEVHSEIGKGSDFVIALPRSASP